MYTIFLVFNNTHTHIYTHKHILYISYRAFDIMHVNPIINIRPGLILCKLPANYLHIDNVSHKASSYSSAYVCINTAAD